MKPPFLMSINFCSNKCFMHVFGVCNKELVIFRSDENQLTVICLRHTRDSAWYFIRVKHPSVAAKD